MSGFVIPAEAGIQAGAGCRIASGVRALAYLVASLIRRMHMTNRQEVYRSGTGLVCRSIGIHMHLEAVVQKIATFQESIVKKCNDAIAAKAARWEKSGSQCVFEIIHESEKGIDLSSIKQATGFRDEKIAQILHTLFKYGEIRIEPGGLYVAVAGR
jgi:hypothetical protein